MLRDKAAIEKEHDGLKLAMSKRAADEQSINKLCEDIEDESKAVKADLAARKTESAQWPSELSSLNLTMDRKLADSTSSIFPHPIRS